MRVRISHLRRFARGVAVAVGAWRAVMLNHALSLEPQTGRNGLQLCCKQFHPEALTWTVAS